MKEAFFTKSYFKTYFRRIVGGQEAKAHSWPWMAFLDFGRKWCGGTIIHPKYIITAVHCVHKEALPRIILGAHDKMNEDQNVIVKAKKITLFPEVNILYYYYFISQKLKNSL